MCPFSYSKSTRVKNVYLTLIAKMSWSFFYCFNIYWFNRQFIRKKFNVFPISNEHETFVSILTFHGIIYYYPMMKNRIVHANSNTFIMLN